MAFQIPPRTGVVTTTTGTGAYALGTTALATHRTFAQAVSAGWLADGDTVPYWCADAGTPAAIEEGIGTYSAGANTLTRTTIFRSSSGGAAINWAGGSKDLVVGFTSTGILALLAAANVFTADQVIRKATPIFDLDALSSTDCAYRVQSNGVRRGRFALVLAGPYVEVVYRNASEVDKGHLRVGDGTLRFYDGTTLTDVEHLPGGGVTGLFWKQATAPPGWVKSTTDNDAALRVVSGTPGASGGSRGLSTATTGDHTLTESNLPPHTHPVGAGQDYAFIQPTGGTTPDLNSLTGGTRLWSASSTTGSTGGGTAHNHPLALKYVDGLIAFKS